LDTRTPGRGSLGTTFRAPLSAQEIIDGGALLSRVQRAGISLSDIYQKEATRFGSIRKLKAALADAYS